MNLNGKANDKRSLDLMVRWVRDVPILLVLLAQASQAGTVTIDLAKGANEYFAVTLNKDNYIPSIQDEGFLDAAKTAAEKRCKAIGFKLNQESGGEAAISASNSFFRGKWEKGGAFVAQQVCKSDSEKRSASKDYRKWIVKELMGSGLICLGGAGLLYGRGNSYNAFSFAGCCSMIAGAWVFPRKKEIFDYAYKFERLVCKGEEGLLSPELRLRAMLYGAIVHVDDENQINVQEVQDPQEDQDDLRRRQ